MKQITLTAAVFLFSLSLYACSTDSSTSDNIQETSVSVTEYKTVTSSVSSSVLISSVSESSTASVSTSASESSVTSETEETTTETLPYDYNDVELSILSNMDNPDYTAIVVTAQLVAVDVSTLSGTLLSRKSHGIYISPSMR